jgi:hypothetical protein
VTASGAAIVNSLTSNTSVQTATLNATANATVNALTVNNSTTIGGTLGVGANINGTGLTLSGSQTVESTIQAAGGIQATPIGNVTPSTGRFSVITGDALTITGNTVLGNLDVLGNITYINSLITTIHDPILELNTGPNGTPLSGSAPYDSGLKTHYWDGTTDRSAFFGRSNSSGYFEYFSNVTSETGNVITGTYGTIKSGNLILTSNATIPNITSGNIRNDNYFYANGDPFTGIKVITSSAPPVAGNVVGDQWYNTTNNAMYEYQFDGTNYFWVDITGPAFGYSEQITSNTGGSSETLSPFLLMGA